MIVSDKIRSYTQVTWEDIDANTRSLIEALSPEEQELFLHLMMGDDAAEAAKSSLYALEYERPIIDIRTWLDDDYFLGNIGRSLYQVWKDDLIELFEFGNYDRAVLTGGVGVGKSSFTQVALIRMIYEASCLRDPAVTYGLAPGTMISFCNLATTKDTAVRVVLDGISSKLKESPYFRVEFPLLKDNKEELIFPKNLTVVAGASNDTSMIGLNIFGGIMDEVNFWGKVKGSKTTQLTKRGMTKTKAYVIYESMLRRMKSRYAKRGKLPGILILSSSKTDKDSLTDSLINEAKASQDHRVFIKDRSIIDVKADMFSTKKFRVLVGTENYMSRILEDDEDITHLGDEAAVIEVPEDFRRDFESDIQASLRDLAGVATLGISSFFAKMSKVDEMLDNSRTHPFECASHPDPAEWDGVSPYKIHWDKIARQNERGEWQPVFYPDRKRFVGMDPAFTGDAFGFVMGCVCGVVPVRTEGEIQEYLPVYHIDFVLRIKALEGEEIRFQKVRELIYSLSEHGFAIRKCVTDTYQSRDMTQTLSAQGYAATQYSVDESKDAYRVLREAVYDGRVKVYGSPYLFHELKKLEELPTKIDHPDNGGKDLADALCQVVYALSQDGEFGERVLPSKGVSDIQRDDGLMNDMVDENFIPIQKTDAGVPMADNMNQPDQVKVYKKGPKTIGPSYNKIKSDGTVERINRSSDSILEIEVG